MGQAVDLSDKTNYKWCKHSMTNIEIKAHYESTERAEENLNAIGAGPAGTFHQRDTYFRIAKGRLKLRELGPDDGHLIFYEREDLAGPKRSDYEIAKTEDPEAIRNMLSRIMGIWIEVEKTRQVWLWENVRIHLDDVKGLGQFVELEAVTEEQGIEESHRRVETLMRALEITTDQLVEGSYGDMLAARA
jgi:predicted adenylyl cyclase CyaB